MKSKGTSDETGATSKTAELKHAIRQMARVVAELDQFIEAEEVKTKIHDMADPAYSTFAVSARERRDKLRASVRRLKMELAAIRGRMGGLAGFLLSAPLHF